jgi:glycosyltransferase involved in cell wall biosynthesis
VVATTSPRRFDFLDALRGPVILLAREVSGDDERPYARRLLDLGIPVERVHDGAIDPGSAELVWIWGAPGWYPRAVRSLLRMTSAERPAVLVWHSEPLPTPRAAGLPGQTLHAREIAKILLRDPRTSDPSSNLRRLLSLARQGFPHILVVTSQGARETLAERGIPADVVPMGSTTDECRDLRLERDLDVLFVGALDVPRRKRLLRRLRAAGVEVVALGSWSDRALWGDARTQLLNRARIVLNLSRFPGQFSGHRLLVGMAGGALVVSEPIYRPDPFVPSEHYVSAAADEMPSVISYFLAHEQERLAIAAQGRRFVSEELTMERSLERIAGLVEAHRTRGR